MPLPPPELAQRVVLFIDMVSYSRHIGVDEASTLEFMAGCFDRFRILAGRFNGTLVKTLGDGALVLFDDPADAVRYGLEFQNIVSDTQSGAPDPYMFRVGLHMGNVHLKNGDVFGNTVNIAARLQEKARPGECVLSRVVYEAIGDETGYAFEHLGEQSLKNIRGQVVMYRVTDQIDTARPARQTAIHHVAVLGGWGAAPNGNGRARGAYPQGTDAPGADALGADARAALGYLAMCPGRADSLDRLEALIGSPQRLSEALSDLSAADAAPLRRIDRMVALDIRETETDLEVIAADLRRGQVPELLSQDPDWPDHILNGLDDVSPVFRSWVRIARSIWRRRILGELEQLIQRTTADDPAHETAADAILLLEPGNEIGSHARITARHARGDQGAALDEYARLESYLSASYGVSPGPRIQDLIRSILSGGGHGGDDQSRGPSGGGPSSGGHRRRRMLRIAVAEFKGTPGETNGEATGEANGEAAGIDPGRVAAFRSDLIQNLAPFRDWSIIDGKQVAARTQGEPDQIDYLFEGAVIARGDQPMLSLRLSKTPDGRMLWADSVSLSSSDWTRSQLDVIGSIAAKLESYISSDRLAMVIDGSRMDLTSHDSWLRGDRALMRWTPEGAEEARRIFTEILREDPDHAPSLFRLASITNIRHVIWPGRASSAAEHAEADRLAMRAVELDPMDARVQRTVAWTAAMTGAFARASMHMDQATSLNPNSPTTLASCAMGFAWFGEHGKAEANLTRCLAISRTLPEWGWAYNASTCFFLGRLDAALEAAELGGTSIIDIQGWIAAIHARRGDTKAAGAAFARFFETISASWAGAQPATPALVAEWFSQAFPLRETRDRQLLRGSIHAASAAAGY